MNSDRNLALIERGLREGASFYVQFIDGDQAFFDDVDDFVEWAENPTGYFLRMHDAIADQLTDWLERGGGGGISPGPRCIAWTRAGKRCKNHVMSCHDSGSFGRFVELDRIGGYCSVHEGHRN